MDCISGMRQIDKNAVSLIITDPPYSISRDSNMRNQHQQVEIQIGFEFQSTLENGIRRIPLIYNL